MAMEKQHITLVVILELPAAFEMVDHNFLLKIMESQFGVTDTSLKWFNSYLRPRSFKVHIGDEYSESQQLSFSVPWATAVEQALSPVTVPSLIRWCQIG